MAWVFGNNANTIVVVDGILSVPWDNNNMRPTDFTGYVGRLWLDAGSPIPEPYPSA